MNSQQTYIALETIVTKEIRRFTRIWVQTLLPPAITMCLYFVIFGNIVGSRVGKMGGFDYMQYIVPGLIMMSVITNSYSNVVSSFHQCHTILFLRALLLVELFVVYWSALQ